MEHVGHLPEPLVMTILMDKNKMNHKGTQTRPLNIIIDPLSQLPRESEPNHQNGHGRTMESNEEQGRVLLSERLNAGVNIWKSGGGIFYQKWMEKNSIF